MSDKNLTEEQNEEELRKTPPMARALAEYEKLISDPQPEDKPKPSEKEKAQNAHLYLDEMGRQHAMEDTQAQGGFYIQPTRRHLTKVCVGLTLPSVFVTAFVMALLDLMLIKAPERASNFVLYIFIMEGVTLLGVGWLVLYACITRTRGKLYKYRADGAGFYVTTKEPNKITGKEMIIQIAQIFYKDVRGVAYTHVTRLRGDYGYKVDIVMPYGTVHFDYMLPHFNHSIPTHDLPFDIIKRNIPKQDE